MNTSIGNFLKEEDGITALEYGILAALVTGVLVATVGPGITTVFSDIFTYLEGVIAKI